jgi:diguanylate cyclase (GGDEF)-like protein
MIGRMAWRRRAQSAEPRGAPVPGIRLPIGRSDPVMERVVRERDRLDRATADRLAIDRLRRQRFHRGATAAVNGLATALCVMALSLPGVVRPGPWRAALIALTLIQGFYTALPFLARRLPETVIVSFILIQNGMIIVGAACLADRTGAALVGALFALPAMYVAMFLPRPVLLVQVFVVVAGATVIMLGLDGSTLMKVAYVAIIGVSTLTPAVAVSLLRARLVEAIRQARELSLTDPLTGLVNRRGIADRAGEVVRHARASGVAVGVVVADVDHFKRINDRHGHAVGDEVLCLVAAVMRGCVKSPDLAVRLGGEELAVIIAIAPEELRDLAEGIRGEVALATAKWSVTVSLGVAWALPPAADDDSTALAMIWALVDQADDRMYAAKRAGRNRVTMPTLAEQGLS